MATPTSASESHAASWLRTTRAVGIVSRSHTHMAGSGPNACQGGERTLQGVELASVDSTHDEGTVAAATDMLLREREARGLGWAARARLAYILLGAVLGPVTSSNQLELLFLFALIAVGTVMSLWVLREAKHQHRLMRAGTIGIAFDVLTCAVLPISWFHAQPGDAPAVFLLKARIDGIVLVLAAVNALSLRPLYPLIVTGAGALVRIGFLVVALQDPRTYITWDPLKTHLEGGLHPVFFVWEVLSVLIVGALLALLTAGARKTVRVAIQAEAQNWQLREQQAQLVADAKITGMGHLVAGVAHELNTPLGTARSSFDSLRRVAERLASALQASEIGEHDRRVLAERVLPAAASASQAGEEGLSRIASLMHSLRDFSRLDAAEAQRVDLHTGLDAAIELVPPYLRNGVELERDYQPLPRVACRPAELNQVFLTILTNALEAVAGKGRVTVRTRSDAGQAIVEVEDTGPGIARERLAELFEVGLTTKDRRVGLRVGLPIARRVVHQHGGSIRVQSQPGRGTVMAICLPVG